MNILKITSRFKENLKRYKYKTEVIDKLEETLKTAIQRAADT